MISDERMAAVMEVFQDRWDGVRLKYLRLVGEHIKQIGALSVSDLHKVEQILVMGKNIKAIEKEIARVTDLSARDVRALLRAASRSVYEDAGYLYDQPDFDDNATMQTLFEAQSAVTLGEMLNLSRTTVVSSAYRAAVDDAITAVQTGVVSYTEAISAALKKVVAEGLRVVDYKSGYSRRVDSAMRQNILDGVRALNRSIADAVGKEFGSDGVEISAHFDCATDHLEIQGKQYSNAQFETLQGELSRPIGTNNCKHFPSPILLGVSDPLYSKDELAKLREQSSAEITIDGKTKTRYDWTQEQRRLETAVRRQKDAAVLAASVGDDKSRRGAQANIKTITRAYARISEAAGLPERRDLMRVAGYRPVRTA